MSHMTIREALAYYSIALTDDQRTDVHAALREAARRRKEGPRATAALIAHCRSEFKMSYRDIEAASVNPDADGAHIDHATAQRIDNKRSR